MNAKEEIDREGIAVALDRPNVLAEMCLVRTWSGQGKQVSGAPAQKWSADFIQEKRMKRSNLIEK